MVGLYRISDKGPAESGGGAGVQCARTAVSNRQICATGQIMGRSGGRFQFNVNTTNAENENAQEYSSAVVAIGVALKSSRPICAPGPAEPSQILGCLFEHAGCQLTLAPVGYMFILCFHCLLHDVFISRH